MLCKQEVCEWFHNLNAASRIDFVCELLKMCLPFELRLFGSCLEELASKDFLNLKDYELKANSFKGLRSIDDLALTDTRSKLITYVCLLYPSNKECSTILFSMLTSLVPKLKTLLTQTPVDDYLEDILLLMTIAVHHPAFCFSQKRELIEHLNTLKTLCAVKVVTKNGVDSIHSPVSSSSGLGTRHSSRTFGCLQGISASHFEISDCGSVYYCIEARWKDQPSTTVKKTMTEIQRFHQQLVECLHPDTLDNSSEKYLKHLQTLFSVVSSFGGSSSKQRISDVVYSSLLKKLDAYFGHLAKAPQNILQSEHVLLFLSPSSTPAAATSADGKERWADPTAASRTGTAAASVCDSLPLSVASQSSSANVACRNRQSPVCIIPPEVRPQGVTEGGCHMSPSRSWSPGEVQSLDSTVWLEQWLKCLRLHKYLDLLKKIPRDELLRMKEDDFKDLGLAEGASKRLVQEIEKLKHNVNGFSFVPDVAHYTGSPLLGGSTEWTTSTVRPSCREHHLATTIITNSGNRSAAAAAESSGSEHSSPQPSPRGSGSAHSRSRLKDSTSCVQDAAVPASKMPHERANLHVAIHDGQAVPDRLCAGGTPSRQSSETNVDEVSTQRTHTAASVVASSARSAQQQLSTLTVSAKESAVGQVGASTSMSSPSTLTGGKRGRKGASSAKMEVVVDNALPGSPVRSPPQQQSPRLGSKRTAAPSTAQSNQQLGSRHGRGIDDSAAESSQLPRQGTDQAPTSLGVLRDSVDNGLLCFGELLRSSPSSSDAGSTVDSELEMAPSYSPSGVIFAAHPGAHSAMAAGTLNPACRCADCCRCLIMATGPAFVRHSAAYPQRSYGHFATLPASFHQAPRAHGGMSQNGMSSGAGDLFFHNRSGSFVIPAGSTHHSTMAGGQYHPLVHGLPTMTGRPPPHHITYVPSHGGKRGCYNCGHMSHRASECRDPSIDKVISSHYRLNYEPPQDQTK